MSGALGAGSNVVVDGVARPLVVPSGLQSACKLVGEFDVPESRLVEPALDGRFLLTLLKAGTYTVAIDVSAPLRDTTLAGVVVIPQNTTDLGEILLDHLPD